MSSITEIGPGVVVVPDHLTASDCSAIVVTANTLEWEKAYLGLYRDDQLIERKLDLQERDVEVSRLPGSFDELQPGYTSSVGALISNAFNLPGLIVDGFVMSKYATGCHIKPHTDTGIRSTSRIVTCVQYFNQSYDGGEVVFPKLNVRYRPKEGDLLMFWSEYQHAVAQITGGVRYCLVFFGRVPVMLQL